MRFLASFRLCAILAATALGVALIVARARAFQPTVCADPAAMRAKLARYALPIRDTYLTNPDPAYPSAVLEDPLVDHINDFIRAGREHNLDPRLAPAIAGAESSFGSAYPWKAFCLRTANNPYSLKVPGPDNNFLCQYFVDQTRGVEAVSADLERKRVRRQCTSIAKLNYWVKPYAGPQRRFCQWSTATASFYNNAAGKSESWVEVVQGHFGRYQLNLGGYPYQDPLTFREECPRADCNGDGRVTVDELVTVVQIALGEQGIAACEAALEPGDCQYAAVATTSASGESGSAGAVDAIPICGQVTVADVVAAVRVALHGPGDPVS